MEDSSDAGHSPESKNEELSINNNNITNNKISKLWQVMINWPSSSSSSSSWWNNMSMYKMSGVTASLAFVFLFICTFLFTRWSDFSTYIGSSMNMNFSEFSYNFSQDYPKREEYSLNCTSSNMTITCPANYSPRKSSNSNSNLSKETCPDYFRWIHEDLKTWKRKGITREMVENLKTTAHFRLIIVNGTAYVKQYAKAYQTRDVYNLWGILQLLKLYPGRVPDLDLMFQCHDQSSIKKDRYPGTKAAFAPPQFHYCRDDSTLDIVFPDWSFWGWPEVNIKPWVPLVKDLKEGNIMKNWSSREPFAFWRGNLYTGARTKLGDCNSPKKWNAQIINQNWVEENKLGFKNSDLSKQCLHRYKIYIEGNAWSVSDKYILACDSMSLFVEPNYYDFFTRSLIPITHYWPINPNNLCKSIKFAVDWGNKNTKKAQEIGKAGSDFVFNQIKIEHVYDYMFHVLYQYAKLLRYKPTVPEGSVELCSEKFACSPMGLETNYKIETMVHGPNDRGPCILPEPFDLHTLRAIRDQKAKNKKLVQMWEKRSG